MVRVAAALKAAVLRQGRAGRNKYVAGYRRTTVGSGSSLAAALP